MSEYLKEEDILLQRDEAGKLIPVEVILTLMDSKPKIKLTPLTRGEILKIQDIEKDIDKQAELVFNHLIVPKPTSIEKIKDYTPREFNAIWIALLSLSLGINQETIENEVKETINLQTNELKKN